MKPIRVQRKRTKNWRMPESKTTPQANAEMIEGFMDGYDLSNPEPSENRSHSYRHGFRSGRADKGQPRKESYEQVLAMAEEAMRRDANA